MFLYLSYLFWFVVVVVVVVVVYGVFLFADKQLCILEIEYNLWIIREKIEHAHTHTHTHTW